MLHAILGYTLYIHNADNIKNIFCDTVNCNNTCLGENLSYSGRKIAHLKMHGRGGGGTRPSTAQESKYYNLSTTGVNRIRRRCGYIVTESCLTQISVRCQHIVTLLDNSSFNLKQKGMFQSLTQQY